MYDRFLPIIGVIGFVALWYLAVVVEVVDPVLLPDPVDAARAVWTGMTGGSLLDDFLKTVERTTYSIVIAAVFAIPLGILLGSSERLYRSVPLSLYKYTRAGGLKTRPAPMKN